MTWGGNEEAAASGDSVGSSLLSGAGVATCGQATGLISEGSMLNYIPDHFNDLYH